MSEIMDDYDAGFMEGHKCTERNIRNEVHDLCNEVAEAYESMKQEGEGAEALRENEILQCQINAVNFTRSWILSGGQTDADGKRACYPW